MNEINYDEIYSTLSKVNVNEHIQTIKGKKGINLKYLSWAWAWTILKQHYPTANYTVYENANGLNYHTDGKTAWVKCGVRIGEMEHIEYLPVMDYSNCSIPLEKITSFDVNTAIQRCTTKAISRFGLGGYIYSGEDIPMGYKEGALERIKTASTVEEIKQIWNDSKDLWNDIDFKNAATKRKNELLERAKDEIINV